MLMEEDKNLLLDVYFLIVWTSSEEKMPINSDILRPCWKIP